MIDFGWLNDQRLQTAMEWLAQNITGEGATDSSNSDANRRQDKSGKAPPFVCSSRNANLPCAWGAINAMIALIKVPPAQRTKNMQKAIKLGVDFLLSHDPAVADYPFGRGNKPSSNWFKFDYPLHGADVLQNLEVLAALGQAEMVREVRFWKVFNEELLEKAPVGIVRLDREGRIAYQNPAMRRILGIPEGVVPLCLIAVGHPDESKEPRTQYDAARVHNERW